MEVPSDGGASKLTWSASMSYATTTTTNNQAEYAGLLI